MDQIFVKCEPECENDLNDHLFSEEEIKVRGKIVRMSYDYIIIPITCSINSKINDSYPQRVFSCPFRLSRLHSILSKANFLAYDKLWLCY